MPAILLILFAFRLPRSSDAYADHESFPARWTTSRHGLFGGGHNVKGATEFSERKVSPIE
ncbi:hypothetical protein L4D06_25200 [Enterovibrio makurazakiensis]|uniref:hypothetical protein n=1 Tax=Enterovibrio makurazakiensis TaxID=2910232 RepID=UPI003D24ABC0